MVSHLLPTLDLLPHCYQDGTNQSHQGPLREHPVLWFLVGLGCRWEGRRMCREPFPESWYVHPESPLNARRREPGRGSLVRSKSVREPPERGPSNSLVS